MTSDANPCGCGKRAYATRQLASDASRRLPAKRAKFGNKQMHTYRCPVSKAWHVGHGHAPSPFAYRKEGR